MFTGKWVQKIEWKQTNGQTHTTDCFTFPTKAIGNTVTLTVRMR